MSTQPQPAPVLAWHREAAKDYDKRVTDEMNSYTPQEVNLATIIAAHDPHAETVRLLGQARINLDHDKLSYTQNDLAERIDCHLAKLKGTK